MTKKKKKLTLVQARKLAVELNGRLAVLDKAFNPLLDPDDNCHRSRRDARQWVEGLVPDVEHLLAAMRRLIDGLKETKCA